ncbi:hypothetical protein EV385_6369 [Krasilnikovia cinnamomea]|uniref:Uncharacterized protein n=1 Tax=Krasilnikovia cinnamomea TaxID=349313 RepID=A0A4Q7ZT68_9ACTN|nr:hypothetical protein [Krasilnikovia cinnamomea]RZU54418.1 hypothetical protein EV385_6369 [Krasilnikovia cinnamomea]
MSSLLEQRYRTVLRLLPADYRQAWGDDMVASFMQAAYAAAPEDPEGVEISRPSFAEAASIAALALRLRLGGSGAAPRPFSWGEAVRRVALIGLLAQAAGALSGVILLTWALKQLPGAMPLPDATPAFGGNRWLALWSFTVLLWLPAYLSAVHGHHRAARLLAAVAFLPVLVGGVLTMTDAAQGGVTATRVAWLVLPAVPLLALAAFGPDAPRMRTRPWLIALPVGTVVLVAVGLAAQPWPGREQLVLALADWPGLWSAGVTAAAVACLSVGRRDRLPVWPLALALLVPPVLALRVITVLDYVRMGAYTHDTAVAVTIGVIQSVVLVTVGAVLAGTAAHRLRRLPAPTDTAHHHTAATTG